MKSQLKYMSEGMKTKMKALLEAMKERESLGKDEVVAVEDEVAIEVYATRNETESLGKNEVAAMKE